MGAAAKIFEKWFGRWAPRIVYTMGARPTRYDRQAYEQACVRAIIDCIATHTAKADAMHVIMDKSGRVSEIKRASPYVKLINQRPNELMTGYDLKYKLISQLESYTTAMLYVKWDGPKPVGIYPVTYRQFEMQQIPDGSWAAAFTDPLGQEHKLPMEDCVILRKYYNNSDVYGEGNEPLYDVLSINQAAENGLAEAVRVSNKIRLVHKQKRTMLSPADAQNGADDFARRFEQAAQNGGVVGMDMMEDVVPINIPAYSVSADQMKDIRDRLFIYWRVSDAMLHSDYTEQQWQAFYESIVEPLLIALSQALTNVLFTQAERDKGNRIIMTASTLLHTSTSTKIQLMREARESGLFTINEQRELFGYPPVEGGDKRQVSLNYVSAENQDQYQVGKEKTNESEG